MEKLPVELFYGLLVAGYLLIRFMKYRFGQKAQSAPPQHDRPDDDEAEEAAPDVVSVAVDPTGSPAKMAVFPVSRRFSRSSLLGTRRDVQNAVVIATVLGPCRAFQPHDVG